MCVCREQSVHGRVLTISCIVALLVGGGGGAVATTTATSHGSACGWVGGFPWCLCARECVGRWACGSTPTCCSTTRTAGCIMHPAQPHAPLAGVVLCCCRCRTVLLRLLRTNGRRRQQQQQHAAQQGRVRQLVSRLLCVASLCSCGLRLVAVVSHSSGYVSSTKWGAVWFGLPWCACFACTVSQCSGAQHWQSSTHWFLGMLWTVGLCLGWLSVTRKGNRHTGDKQHTLAGGSGSALACTVCVFLGVQVRIPSGAAGCKSIWGHLAT